VDPRRAPRLSAALLGAALLVAAGCSAPAGLAEPVTIQIPQALPATAGTAADEPAAPPRREDMYRRLVGEWTEQFTGRDGCSDSALIAEKNGALVITSQDCNNGTPYVVDPPKYDGSTLEVTLHVPETANVVRYRFHWLPDGNLGGEVAVSGGGGGSTQTYKVRWVRRR
jgi:hypothetical protein